MGILADEYARRWMIPTGVAIGNALGDNQASLYGSLTDPSNQFALTIGTGAQLSVVVPELPKDDTGVSSRYEFRPYVGDSYIAVVASLSGERYDLSLRGSFTNLSFETFTIGDMTAALSRGLVASLKDALPPEFLNSKREVVGSGNAIRRSPLMQHTIRECFGCTLKLQEGTETTACGAALLASRMLA